MTTNRKKHLLCFGLRSGLYYTITKFYPSYLLIDGLRKLKFGKIHDEDIIIIIAEIQKPLVLELLSALKINRGRFGIDYDKPATILNIDNISSVELNELHKKSEIKNEK